MSRKTDLDRFGCSEHPLKVSDEKFIDFYQIFVKEKIKLTRNFRFLQQLQTFSDPLKSRKTSVETNPTNVTSLNLALDGSDPLSQFARLDEISPLSETDGNRKSIQKVSVKFQSWASKRPAILNKYTTSEKLSIVTSFLTGGEISKSFLEVF